jgi:hypothetical protein
MRRLAGALALVFMFVAVTLSTSAAARQNTYARVKCVGLYCAIVSVPAPRLRQGYDGQVRRGHGMARQPRQRHGGRAGVRGRDAEQVVAHPDGCPRVAFCGCGAAVEVFGRPVRALWLTANWLRFPLAIAVRRTASLRSP